MTTTPLEAGVELAKVAIDKGYLAPFEIVRKPEDAKKFGNLVATFINTVKEELQVKEDRPSIR